MAGPLENRELRALKARAQLLKPLARVGKDGISPALLKSLDDALTHHGLVKVKFDHFKEQKKELMPQLAEKVSAHIILRVGNVLVLFRRKPAQSTG
jgi:RNA-binding protein